MKRILVAIAVTASVSAHGGQQPQSPPVRPPTEAEVVKDAAQTSKPTIAALFSNESNGPAFWIECRNSSGHEISVAGDWVHSYHIDGIEPLGGGFAWSAGPGQVAPGNVWRGAFAFAGVRTNLSGTDATHIISTPLTAGQHTLAVGRWTCRSRVGY